MDELRSIVAETRSKIASCDAISADLEVMLSDLQQQRDFAQDLIKETCQSYKAVVEKCQVCTEYIACRNVLLSIFVAIIPASEFRSLKPCDVEEY